MMRERERVRQRLRAYKREKEGGRESSREKGRDGVEWRKNEAGKRGRKRHTKRLRKFQEKSGGKKKIVKEIISSKYRLTETNLEVIQT